MERFPYGKPVFWITVLAITAFIIRLYVNSSIQRDTPDLVFVTFAQTHYEAYLPAVKQFEKDENVKIRFQVMQSEALYRKLQAGLLTGIEVPDLVEIHITKLGGYSRGPLSDVGFVELTDKIKDEGIDSQVVTSRFKAWSRFGHIFALPHDVHPTMLCYRRDIVEQLGINVDSLKTWDDFARIGRSITKDLDGDGNPDRYMIDLPRGGWLTENFIQQRGDQLFDSLGRVAFDTDGVIKTIIYLVKASIGKDRFAFEAGWGQTLNKSMIDGFTLFYICPDWRTKIFETDIPSLSGKIDVMPLPVWEEGGRKTFTWGGAGILITKKCKKQELAWKLMKKLYLDPEQLGQRFSETYLIPSVKKAWERPELSQPVAFFNNKPIGSVYVALAPETPPIYDNPYYALGRSMLEEAYLNIANRFENRGEDGLEEYARKELKRCADYVRAVVNRNKFLKDEIEQALAGAGVKND